MARLPRKTQRIFAGNAVNNGQFGSAQLGTKVLSNDLETIQDLAAWVNGWNDATISGQRLPTLEEMQGLQYVMTSQLAYLFERGFPEFDAGTNYFVNSIVIKAGTFELYGSLTDNNLGNALPDQMDNTDWKFLADLADIGGDNEVTFVVDRLDGDGVNTTFPLSALPAGEIYMDVWVDSVKQIPGTDANGGGYTLSGQNLVLNSPALAGTNNVVVIIKFVAGIVGAPADNTVSTEKLQDGAVTLGKLDNDIPITSIQGIEGNETDVNLPTTQAVADYVNNAAPRYSGSVVPNTDNLTTGWTEVDFSSIVGAKRTLIYLAFRGDQANNFAFRVKGETRTRATTIATAYGAGASASYSQAASIVYLTVLTDESGVAEWSAEVASTGTTLEVLTYQEVLS